MALKENDPYRAIEAGERASITGETKPRSKHAQNAPELDVQSNLTNAEHNATRNGSRPTSRSGSATSSNYNTSSSGTYSQDKETDNAPQTDVDAARNNETAGGDSPYVNNVGRGRDKGLGGGFFRGSGKNNLMGKSSFSGKGNAKGPIKRGRVKGRRTAPTVIVLVTVMLCGIFILLAQFFLPFSISAQVQDVFGTLFVTNVARTKSFVQKQMDEDRAKNPTKARMFSSDKFQITNKQAKQLKEQGIEYKKVDADGKKIRVFEFDDGLEGKPVVVAANEKDANRLKAAGGGTQYPFVATHDEMRKGSMDYNNAMRRVFEQSNKKLWFDSKTANFLKRFGLTRQLFADFISDTEDKQKGNTKSAMAKVEEQANKTDTGVKATSTTSDKEDPDHPNPKVTPDNLKDMDKNSSSLKKSQFKQGRAAARAAMAEFTKKYAGKTKATGIVGQISNLTCVAASLIAVIKLMIMTHQITNQLTLSSAYLEAADKAKAGNGDGSVHGMTTDIFTDKGDTTYYQDGEVKIAKSDVPGGASEGVAAIYDNDHTINQNDISVQNVSVNAKTQNNDFFSKLGDGIADLTLSVQTFTICATVRLFSALVDAGTDIAELAFCISAIMGGASVAGVGAVAGAGACALAIIGSAIMNIIIAGGIATGIAVLSPRLADWSYDEYKKDISGMSHEDKGNAFAAGAQHEEFLNHLSGGGSLASEQKYKEFAQVQSSIIAEQAEYERQNLSPFDMTSKNTFLGNLTNQAIAFAFSSSTTSGVLPSIGKTVSSSVQKLWPDVYADSLAKSFGKCSELNEIGAVGNGFCNPYSATDTSTLAMDPADVVEKVDGSLVDKEGDVPEIAQGSQLAKYVYFCENRTSPFGIADQNFAAELSTDEWQKAPDLNKSAGTSDTIKTVVQGASYAVPIAGDLSSIMEDSKALANLGWISGQACVANETNSTWNNETKYYQRFEEDQRLAKEIGLIDKTSSEIFMEQYYERHPLDNSLEGLLAQQTGQTKETISDALIAFKEFQFLANYDPTDLGPLPVEQPEFTTIDFSTPTALAQAAINLDQFHANNSPQHHIAYADLRTRTQVA